MAHQPESGIQYFKTIGDSRVHHRPDAGACWYSSEALFGARAIRVEFITRLYFALAIYKERASQLIDEQITESHKHLEILKSALDLLPLDQTFNRLALELRVRQLESILDWLPQCSTALGQ